MVGLLAKRLVAGVGVLMVLTAVVFFLRQLSPVDPARALVGAKASASVVAAERKKLGLDDPIVIQYFRYLGNVVRGNFGESAVTHNAIGTDLGHFLTATTELLTVAFVLAAVFALIFAVATVGRWRGSGVLRMVMVVMSALPVFLTAVLGIIVFYEWLHWLPATGQSSYANAPSGPTGFLLIDSLLAGRLGVTWDAVVHLLLPASCLAIAPAVAMGRVLRSSLQHAMRSDYVRTARAKGQGELRVMLAHGLRNSLGPVLAMGGVRSPRCSRRPWSSRRCSPGRALGIRGRGDRHRRLLDDRGSYALPRWPLRGREHDRGHPAGGGRPAHPDLSKTRLSRPKAARPAGAVAMPWLMHAVHGHT